jgi:hypothetical protein
MHIQRTTLIFCIISLLLASNVHAQVSFPIILNYSTYIPPPDGNPKSFETAIASVDSSGSACVLDGYGRLWVYDPAGNPTLLVASVSSAGLDAQLTFRDTFGNCFVAGIAFPSLTAPPGILFGFPTLGVAKFGPTGVHAFTTFFGGPPGSPSSDRIGGLTVDPQGNIYVAGTTSSAAFPTHNALQSLIQGPNSVFILKLDPTGSTLIYSTFFGNNTGIFDSANAITTDAAGDAFIVGIIGYNTSSSIGSITTTPGAFQTSANQARSPFVAKLSPAGTLIYGTYLGAAYENAIAVDGLGNAYVAGQACSPDFQTTPGAYQTILPPGDCAGAVSKLSPDGSGLVYSTFLGSDNSLDGIAVDGSGRAYVKGSAISSIPLVNPIQSDVPQVIATLPVPQATLTAIDSAGDALLFSTLFGGDTGFSGTFERGGPVGTTASSLGIDAAGNVYISGSTSIEGFPIFAANNGLLEEDLPCNDNPDSKLCSTRGFVAKISPGSGTVLASPSGVDFGIQVLSTGQQIQSSLFIANVGTTNIQINGAASTGDFSIGSNTCGALPSAIHCNVVVNFKPTGSGTRTGTLTITSDAPDSPRNIQLTGIGGVPQVSLSPASLALTSPNIGATGPVQTFTLSNTGQDVLNLSGIAITGASAADFSETHNCPSQLVPSGVSGFPSSCQINLSYKASTSNAESAALQIIDDAAGSPHIANLTGVVSALGLAIGPGMPSTLSISAGQTATYNLVVGGPGFTGSVSLSCSGSPSAASCNVPSSVGLGATPTSFQVTVKTTARSTATTFPNFQEGGPQTAMAYAISGFGVLIILLISKRGIKKPLLLACAFLCAIFAVSCGGTNYTSNPTPTPVASGTPAGTYTLTVVANNGAGLTQSVSLTLNVN